MVVFGIGMNEEDTKETRVAFGVQSRSRHTMLRA
jgi:hypothetical protein